MGSLVGLAPQSGFWEEELDLRWPNRRTDLLFWTTGLSRMEPKLPALRTLAREFSGLEWEAGLAGREEGMLDLFDKCVVAVVSESRREV